jgi:hypothetical protein
MEQLKPSYSIQELQLIYKLKYKPSDRPKIVTSADC